MNIFKILASANKGFSEESSSAILRWLLDPTMDHGLGFSFLDLFLDDVARHLPDLKSLQTLRENLKHSFRGNNDNCADIFCRTEYGAERRYIDIVLTIDKVMFAIENKIREEAFTPGQLQEQYTRLKNSTKESNHTIISTYIVPIAGKESKIVSPQFDGEFADFTPKKNDKKIMLTWQRNGQRLPSIMGILAKLLKMESQGLIAPIPEYTRHTIKAFCNFIQDGFEGYVIKRSSGGVNPKSGLPLDLDTLLTWDEGFVGVGNGIAGLIRMDIDTLKAFSFQNTKEDMSDNSNWMSIAVFKAIVNWRLDGKTPNTFEWSGAYKSDVLYALASAFGSRVTIGIQGGSRALESMDNSKIAATRWNILPASEKSSNNWISGEEFVAILNTKGTFPSAAATKD